MLTEFYGPDNTLLGTHEAEYYRFEAQHTALMKQSIVVHDNVYLRHSEHREVQLGIHR